MEPEEFAVDRRDVSRATRRAAPDPVGGLLSPSARDRLPLVDRRSDEDLRKVLAHYKKYPPRIANVSLLLPAIEAGLLPRFLPLSWPADAILSGCNEGDHTAVSDLSHRSIGFNNEDWVYLWDREKAMLVGDSFAAGLCVHQEQSVQGVMRRSGLAAFSTGIGGHGPLLALAALTEYGSCAQAKIGVLALLRRQRPHRSARSGAHELVPRSILERSVHSASRRAPRRRRSILGWICPRWVGEARPDPGAGPQRARGVRRTRTRNLATVRRELNLPDLASLTADADVLRVFKAILSAAERRVRSWGGDLYFVMIPNQDDYRGKIPPYRRAVLDVVQQVGLPVIDLDRPLRASGDPLQFYPLRAAWGHFNPEGYRLFAYSLIDAMVERRQRSADPIALEELDPDNRRLAKVNALVAALRRLNPGISSNALLPLIRGQAIQTQRHDYRPYAGVSKVLEDDGGATVDSGVAMHGATFQPKEAGNLLRVRVHVNGYSEERQSSGDRAVHGRGQQAACDRQQACRGQVGIGGRARV